MTIASTDLLRDVRAEFMSTYKKVAGPSPKLQGCMRTGIPSTKLREYYGYHESPPNIERWDRGEDMPEDELLTRSFNVVNLDWAKAVGWHENDAEDLQLGDLRASARRLAQRCKVLPERIFFQILTAATDASLLKAIPNAPDGAALHATTAGGSNRFGVSSGNLLTGNGVATAAAIRSDFWAAMEQFRLFQDTEGEPLLDDGDVDAGVTVVYGAANGEGFAEAFKQGRTLEYQAGTSTSSTGGAAAVTNTILESGQKITLWQTQRISDNDWFVFLNSPAVPRPIFEQIRQAPRVFMENRSNSRVARRSKREAILVDMRAGYGVALPYGSIKVNN